jgi:predicted N-acetyltransferase YhbS
MEYIKIKGKTYGYDVDFKKDDKLRGSFNSLTRRTYEFDFEEWYKNGYWKGRYIPYSLLDGSDIVSNVSVNIIDFMVLGEQKRYIQIGTVMTDMKYRNLGLNKFLMDKVIEEWKDKSDLIYLFANDSVIDFYPKFGFVKVDEHQHSKEIILENTTSSAIKLDMSDEKNKKLLYDAAQGSVGFSQIYMRDNASLVMFYCTSFMKENVYYIKDMDAFVIAEFDDNLLYLNDVFCTRNIQLNDIIKAIANKDIRKVVFGFTPKDTAAFDEAVLQQEDTTLFMLGDKHEGWSCEKVMFPVLSHA